MKETQTAVVVAALRKKAAPLFRKLPDVIKTKEEYEDAASNMKMLRNLVKESDKEKSSLIDPLTTVIKRIKEHFAPFEQQVAQATIDTKKKMADYLEVTDKKIVQIADDLDSGKIKKATTAIKKQNELRATGNQRMVWTATCVDVKKTPRQFLVPDETAIREVLKAGKKVEGWKWEQVRQIVI